MTRSLKRHWTFSASARINMGAWKRLLFQMHRHDMFLESRVFPKRFTARRVLGAAVLVPSIMSGQMPT